MRVKKTEQDNREGCPADVVMMWVDEPGWARWIRQRPTPSSPLPLIVFEVKPGRKDGVDPRLQDQKWRTCPRETPSDRYEASRSAELVWRAVRPSCRQECYAPL